MGLIRCPKHKIPYNDDNPRGCPACAKEKDRKGDDSAIRELQRASRIARGVEEPPRPVDSPLVEFLTAPPEVPVRPKTRFERLATTVRRHRYLVVSSSVSLILLAVLFVVTRPKFILAPDPPVMQVDPRPLSIQPNSPITTVFELLGPRQPEAVPERPQLARYRYGERISIDALNGRVQAINVGVANRTWRGIAVGIPEEEVRGALTLLGTIREAEGSANVLPISVAGHQVYPSLAQRPYRTLSVSVRPPNGCFDVEVTLKPQTRGILVKGDHRYASLGKGEVVPAWTSTEYRVLNRERQGSGSLAATCPP